MIPSALFLMFLHLRIIDVFPISTKSYLFYMTYNRKALLMRNVSLFFSNFHNDFGLNSYFPALELVIGASLLYIDP